VRGAGFGVARRPRRPWPIPLAECESLTPPSAATVPADPASLCVLADLATFGSLSIRSRTSIEPAELFTKPDRSDYKPNLDPAVKDIGWNEGFFPDARPFRCECWAEDGVTSVTFFFSTAGLENLSRAGAAELIEEAALVVFTSLKRFIGHMPFTDAAGNHMWSTNIVLADEDDTFAECLVQLRPYSRSGPRR